MKATILSKVIENAAKAGSLRVVGELGLDSNLITLTDAYKMHGREIVKRWIKEGLLHVTSSESDKKSRMLNKKQLETVSSSNNRITYLPVRERK